MSSRSVIKKYVYKILVFVGVICYPFNLLQKRYFSLLIDYIYTGYKSSVVNISSNSVIRYPSNLIRGKGIKVGKNSYIGKYAVLTTYRTKDYYPTILIGNNTNIGQYCHITAINHISIGNNVLTGKFVTITDNSHGLSTRADMEINPNVRELNSKGPVIIEDNVWIGDKVTICPNVTIGKGSIIGANSVVTKNIPAFSVVCGITASIIKTL